VSGSGDSPNHLLARARRSLKSPSGSGRDMSRQELADAVNAYMWHRHQERDHVDATYIGHLEQGRYRWPGARRREAFRHVLGATSDADIGFYINRGSVRSAVTDACASGLVGDTKIVAEGLADQYGIERLRRGLNEALTDGTMADASLDDWERAVVRYGRLSRDRPAIVLLDDLATDLDELRRALARHRSASALRRLTRVAAQMAGLMCLTFCRLDDRPAFRRWARTARLAANEAGDKETRSWVLAQEAYGHYYSADLLEAIEVAKHAQAIARTPSVGAALAAALEARALAALGRDQETRAALGRAEDTLSHLQEHALTPSAFGYNEAQLRFHEGSAYTHLKDPVAAFAAQDRAMELCTPGDYTDWAMTRLDRAGCLCSIGDVTVGLNYAAETLAALSHSQRRGILALRGNQLLASLPHKRRALPAARNLQELLRSTTESKEGAGS
jgi:hypothetical protein